jgi:hypothetical protein
MDAKRYLMTEAEVVAFVEQGHGRKLAQQEIARAIGELLEPKEQAFIDRTERSKGRRLYIHEIKRALRRAASPFDTTSLERKVKTARGG